jgi:hypothetical protein
MKRLSYLLAVPLLLSALTGTAKRSGVAIAVAGASTGLHDLLQQLEGPWTQEVSTSKAALFQSLDHVPNPTVRQALTHFSIDSFLVGTK